eukprot:GEZU01016203.1.p1 GENE.GEZU01016203.1~~GEZU01016203.1.p1  ORF type:complete len:227 (-),score=32.82 GEZU01016203.1:107-787(-)
MAWMCSSSSNEGLIRNLKESRIFTSPEVERAMLAVDRKYYVLDEEYAYTDAPQPIGYNVTISAPHMHAMCLELLKDHLKPGNKALDVGSGSGYLTACMAHMVAPEGTVNGIEYVQELVPKAIENITRDPKTRPLLESKNIIIEHGDGWKGKPGMKFDAIHVGAAASELPQALVDQLKNGGRMVIPVGTAVQALYQVDKDANGKVSTKHICGVRYVPLVKEQGPNSG